MKPQARDQTQDVFLRPQELGFLARLPVEDKDRRVTDGPQRVAGLDQAAAGEVFAVGADREVAHAAIIDPLPRRVVFGEFPRVARAPPFRACGSIRSPCHAGRQRSTCGPVRGEEDPIDGQLVAGQLE
jgi:hypothetical protein